jgi:DNA polymerase gamma 1
MEERELLEAFEPLIWRPQLSDIQFQAGWTRYTPNSNQAQSVQCPLEKVCVFDCETFVNSPTIQDGVIATAVTNKAFYIWLHPSIVDRDVDWQPLFIRLRKGSVAIAHNSSFDSSRVDPECNVLWFCTQSAHVTVSGMCSDQEDWFRQNNPAYVPAYAEVTSPSNLIDVYNLYCFGNLDKSIKKTRNIFVEASSHTEFWEDLSNLTDYAINDTLYTAELFKALFPLYLKSCPEPETLESHLLQSAILTPIAAEWFDWLNNVEHHYELAVEEINQLLAEIAWNAYESWLEYPEGVDNNPWLRQLDWSANWQLNKKGEPKYKNYGIPKWLLKVRDEADECLNKENLKITIANSIAPLLLEISYFGRPLVYDKNWKWCVEDPEDGLVRLPHPEGKKTNVGSVFSQDWVESWENGEFTSNNPLAIEILKKKVQIGFWTSARSRAYEMRVMPLR